MPIHLKRDGEVVRTVIQIVSVLLNNTPYICEKCESELFEIIQVKPEKEWLDQFIKVAKHRPPRSGAVLNLKHENNGV